MTKMFEGSEKGWKSIPSARQLSVANLRSQLQKTTLGGEMCMQCGVNFGLCDICKKHFCQNVRCRAGGKGRVGHLMKYHGMTAKEAKQHIIQHKKEEQISIKHEHEEWKKGALFYGLGK